MIAAYGSYSRNDFLRPISGLGDDASLPLADQALLSIVRPITPVVIVYTEWATQTGDISWQQAASASNYQAYAIADQQLLAAQSLSNAGVPQVLAVISPFLTLPAAVATDFNGTPYEYVKTEAVYSQLDTKEPPTIFFVYWLQLRSATDPNIGSTSLNYVATELGGVLVYLLETDASTSTRGFPTTPFMTALQAQGTGGSLQIPSATPPSPVPSPAPTPIPTVPSVTPTPVKPSASIPVVPAPVTPVKAAPLGPLTIVSLAAIAGVAAYAYGMKAWRKAHG